jgi:uncharacterized phage protein (TIGR01671 family)
MEREIKFRVWDKHNKRMLEWMYPVDCWMRWLNGEDKMIGIMQYTGLKDKNGKEIYEGDILEWNKHKLEVVWGIVGWNLVSELFKYPHQSWNKNPSCGEVNTNGYIRASEIIGNIYENKDLLT